MNVPSIEWKNGEYWISTKEDDGTPRTLDRMLEVLHTLQRFNYNSSALHDWGGTRGDHQCNKCGAWVSGYTWASQLPKRGCNNSRTLTIRKNYA